MSTYSTLSSQVVFILNNISNYQTLVSNISKETPVYVLDAQDNALEEMARILEDYSNLDSIHLLSHGNSGVLNLGAQTLSSTNLNQYQDTLTQIGSALTAEGDFLLYGCNVAEGQVGLDFIGQLAQASGADVGASTDLTGANQLGGDWELESSTGNIESLSINDINSNYLLLTVPTSGTTTFDFEGLWATETSLANGNGTSSVSATDIGGTGWDMSATMTASSSATFLLRGRQNGGNGTISSSDTVYAYSTADFFDSVSFYSNDGVEFSLNSFYIKSTEGATTATVTGYKDNILVSGASLTQSLSQSVYATGPYTLIDTSVNPNFQNIDKFTISFNTPQHRFLFDDITIGPAITTDTTPPTLDGANSTPLDNATAVSISSDIVIDFSESIAFGSSGNITLYNVTTNSNVETFNVATVSGGTVTGSNGSTATISSDKLTINPSGNLLAGTQYSVKFDAGSITDTATTPNNLAAITDNTTYNFTTAAPSVTLSVNNSSIAEAAGTSTITATLSAAAATDTTVTLSTSGTATNGTDYSLSSTSITILAGATTGTATLTATQDTLDEADETAIIDITGVSGGGGATESGSQQATVTITDDDAPPSLSISNVSQAEGNSGTSTMTFTVTLSAASGKTVTVDYATSNGTATAGSDYTAASGTLTFNPNETSKTFTVTIAGDTTTETDETFTVTLSNASNASLGTATATGTITNDENAAPTLGAPGTVTTYTDTPANDSFSSYTGTLSASDAESDALTFGISSPTSSSANYTAGAITYDISKTGTYGTLYVKSSTGQYIYVPVNSAINAVALGNTPNDSFSVTVADASHTGSPTTQTLMIAITGGNDAPTAISLSNTTASTYDGNNAAVGSLTRTDVDGGGPTYSIVSVNANTSGTVYNYFNISGTTLQIADSANTPVGSYTVVVRVNDGTSDYDQSFNLSVSNTLVVDTTGDDAYGGNPYASEKADGGGLSLREAAAFANQAGGGTISFASGLGSLTLGSNITFSENITLDADVVNSLSIAGNMAISNSKTLTLSNAAGDALTLSGDISGSGSSLVKTGAGTLTLSGSNSFSGTLTLSGGTLSTDSLGSASALTLDGGILQARTSANLSSSLGVSITSNGGGLDATNGNVTLSGALTGTGSLSVTGAGGTVVALSGNNSGYSGAITLDTTIIQVDSNTALGTGALTWNSGKIRAGGAGYSVDNAITLGGDVTVSGSNALTFNGSVNFGNASRSIRTDVDTTFSGALSNSSGVFTKSGTGTMTLTNTGNSGTLSSGITVTAGTLSVASDSQLSSGTLTLNGGNLAVTGATTIDNAITLSQAATLTNAGNLTLSGVLSGSGAFTKAGAGTLALSGNSNTQTGAITLSAGALVISTDANLGASNSATITLANGTNFDVNSTTTIDNAITLSGDATLSVNNSAVVTLSGALSGAGTTLTKGGLGTLILSSTSNSAATTTSLRVNGGVLSVDSSSTMVGGTLIMNGGDLTITSTGNTFANAITLSNAATLTNANAATLSGAITGSAALTKAGAGTLTLSSTSNSSAAATLTITAGTVSVSSDSQLVGGSLTLNGGTLNLNNAGTIDNAIALGSNNGTVNVTGGVATLSGIISGTGSLTKTGGQLLTLSGNNTYTGGTTVRGAAGLSITDGSNIGSGTLTLEADLTITSGTTTTISNAIALNAAATISNANAVTLSGVLSGSSDLTKAGAGILTLSGTNTHSGAVTVSTGELRVEGGSSIGDSSAVTVNSGATLTLNGGSETIGSLAGAGSVVLGYGLTLGGNNTNTTFSGVISGTGNGITKTGTGTLTLSGANTYTGSTNVSAGGLTLQGGSSISDSSAVTLSAGATLTLDNANETIGSLAGAGNVVLGSNTLTAGGNNSSTSYSGAISGTGGLTKAGSGTLTLSGANTYTGATTVSAGTLALQGGSSISDSSAVTLSAGATLTLSASETIGSLAGAGNLTLSSHTLTTGGNNTTTNYSGVISGTGGMTKVGSGTLTLSGANSYTGSTTVSAGELILFSGDNLSDSSAVTVASGATLTLNGGNETIASLAGAGSVALGTHTLTLGDNASTTYSGVISGTGALTKSGTGTLTLSGTNTYTGATSVSAGTLVVDGTLASSAVSVANTAKLSGIGTINGAVTLSSGGSIEAGVSLGTLTLSNGLTLSSGSTLAAEVKGTAAGTGYDQISVVGTVNVTGATLSTDLGSFIPTAGNSFTLIDNDGSDAVIGTFNGLAEGAIFSSSGQLMRISYTGGDGNDVVLTSAPSPTVQSVSASTADGIYKAGAEILITVTFSRSVTVTTTGGVPSILLSNNGRTAEYISGSPSNTLTFKYTVQAGDSASSLNYASINALVLNGGTIVDTVSSIDATLDLPATNAVESLDGSKNIVIDSVAPSALAAPTLNTSSNSGSTNDTITNHTTPTVSGSGAENGATITLYDTNGTTILGTATANSSGLWSITSSTLSEGIHNLKVRQTDLAGNISAPSSSLAITVNSSTPSDIALAASNISQYFVLAQATLTTLSTTDTTQNDSFTYELVSGAGGTDNSLFSITGNGLKAASNTLAAGTYSIRVRTTDSAGNIFEKALSITINNDPIQVPIPDPIPADPTTPSIPAPPTTTPSIPAPDTWDQLADNDGDGIPEVVEDLVPSRSNSSGDGNGDGIADSLQTNVASVPFLNTDQVSQEPNAPVIFVTLASSNTVEIDNVTQLDAPSDKPDSIEMPLGLVSFTATTNTGTANFELLIDGNVSVNGYWKQNSSGNWVNLASEEFGGSVVSSNGTTRLNFAIEDGGEFDSDGIANGVIQDPGAIGFNSNSAPTINLPNSIQTGFTAGQSNTLSLIQVADADNDLLTLTLTSDNGSLSNLIDSDLSLDGIQLSGSSEQINEALSTARFTPTLSGLASIDFRLNDGNTTAAIKTYTIAVAPTSYNDQFVTLQYASPNILGAGAGNDTYLISGAMLPSTTNIVLTDVQGTNIIQLADGLSLQSSKVSSNTIQMTLENSAVVTILGADKFLYEVAENTTLGINKQSIGYSSLVQDVLGLTLPTNNSVVIGSAQLISEQQTTALNNQEHPTSKDNQLVVVQHSLPSVVGAGSGDDTYLISTPLLPLEKNIILTDTQGNNSIQLADGLMITASKATNNTLQLTLNSGAVVTVLDADKFNYDIGGNSTLGVNHTDISYQELIQNILKASFPIGGGVSAGGAVTIEHQAASTIALSGVIDTGLNTLLIN